MSRVDKHRYSIMFAFPIIIGFPQNPEVGGLKFKHNFQIDLEPCRDPELCSSEIWVSGRTMLVGDP